MAERPRQSARSLGAAPALLAIVAILVLGAVGFFLLPHKASAQEDAAWRIICGAAS